VKLIPGVGSKLPVGEIDQKKMKHIEAIILSMTPQERKKPEILNGSRRARIARGSGRPVAEVNRLLKQFQEMQKIMKQVRGFMPL
jgi:signal recognition particle subunit SRP54